MDQRDGAPVPELDPTDPANFPRTAETNEILIEAGEWAQREDAIELEPRHLLIALLSERQPNGVARDITQAATLLHRLGVDNTAAIAEGLIVELDLLDELVDESPVLSEDAAIVLEHAIAIAAADGRDSAEVETPHLLMALLDLDPPPHPALRRLREADITAEVVATAFRMSPDGPVGTATPGGSMVIDLTAAARAGRLDPVIGREAEIQRVITILMRRRKNNPVLIGEPGVGKSAIAEALAQRIAEGNVPARLKDKRVLSLEVSRLVGGTVMRGQFEDKVNAFLDEITAAGNVILFIDELHTVVGAGSGGAGDTNDLANFMKSRLARGDLSCVGATTRDEYRQHIESDAALERRFQPIEVEEPDAAETRLILSGLASSYADHHGVSYPETVLDACVSMAARHLPGRHFPDKAIDLLDEAGAEAAKAGREVVSLDDVMSALPLVRERPAGETSGDLRSRLESTVFGQAAAIAVITETIEGQRLDLAPRRSPLTSFVFAGPTASGKATAAAAIADALFDGAMTVIDLAEYAEPHSVAGLIGTPPGYVGFEQRSRLIEPLRHKPAQVVLFKHVDAAHPLIRNLLADILTAGALKDTHEREASFREAVVIFTATTEARVRTSGQIGFRPAPDATDAASPLTDRERTALREAIGPRILEAVDEVVPFGALRRPALAAAIDGRLTTVVEGMARRGIAIEIEPSVPAALLAAAEKTGGMRDIVRSVNRLVERPIAMALTEAPAASGVKVAFIAGQPVASVIGREPALVTKSRRPAREG